MKPETSCFVRLLTTQPALLRVKQHKRRVMISVADVIYHTSYGDALVPLAPRTPKFLPEYRSVELSLHNWKLAGGNSPKLYISPETSRIVPMQLKAGTHVTFTPSSQLRGVGWGVVDTVDMSSTSTTNNFSTTLVRVTVHSWRLANNSYVTISCPANHLNPITPPSVTVLNPGVCERSERALRKTIAIVRARATTTTNNNLLFRSYLHLKCASLRSAPAQLKKSTARTCTDHSQLPCSPVGNFIPLSKFTRLGCT